MIATASSVTPPSNPPYRQLAIAAAVAALGHALLIWGIPRLNSQDISGMRTDAMETRIIQAPLADTKTDFQAQPDTPAPPVPPAPPPAPTPPPPAPAPAPTPAAEPEAQSAPAPAVPVPPAEPAEAATPAPASPAHSSLRSLSEQPTLIDSVPSVSFGGSSGAQPVRPMLSGNQTQTVLGQMAKAVSGEARLPRPADLTYETSYVRGGEGGEAISGRTTLAWRHDKHYYQANWVEHNVQLGSNSYLSTGAVAPQGLAPVTGSWDQSAREKTLFDYTQQVAIVTPPGATTAVRVPIQAGVQDRISAVLHLGALLAGQPERFPTGTRVQLPLIVGDHVENWAFTVQGEEKVSALTNQEVPVVHLVYEAPSGVAPSASSAAATGAKPDASSPAPANGASAAVQLGPTVVTGRAAQSPTSTKRLDVWLGPTLDFLPVRWRIEQFNGDIVTHLARSAVAQRVLSSLPPPADRLPDRGPAAPASSAGKPNPDARPKFPDSGGA